MTHKETTTIPCKVLLVDDEPINLKFLERVCKSTLDVEIHTAKTGEEAVALARENTYAVIVLDVAMPGMDGFQAAEAIRGLAHNAKTPIIFISAFRKREQDFFEGYAKGAVDYLQKPVALQVIRSKLEHFVDMHRTQQATEAELHETEQHLTDVTTLLEAAQAILVIDEFKTSARKIFDAAKKATGATAGYVAMLSPDGAENEVLFLDAGGRPCSVDPELPMPIRGLRAEAYNRHKTVYDNDFMNSPWMEFMPKGHVAMDNVLFAPLILDNEVKGVMGLANKPGDFTEEDARRATAFGNFAAISLRNSMIMEELRQHQYDLMRAQTQAGMGSFVKDFATGEVEWSEGMFAIFGFPPEKVHGKDPFGVLPEDFINRVNALMDRAAEGTETVEQELDVLLADGVRHYLHCQLEPGPHRKNIPVRVFGTCLDLTQQKQMTQQLLSTNRMEAVGQMAAGLAHEVNTPIQYIIGNMDYLDQTMKHAKAFHDDVSHMLSQPETKIEAMRERVQQNDINDYLTEAPEALSDIREGLGRVGTIVSALQKLSPRYADVESFININELVNDLIMLTTQEWRDQVDITTSLADDLPQVMVSRADLGQGVLNVLVNAFQAAAMHAASTGSEKGHVHVCTTRAKNMVCISIEDDGPGIAEDIESRIFDPFFTTKAVGTATGQGLTMAHFIVTAHGGKIHFEPGTNGGTRFIISLPITPNGDEKA